MIRNMGTIDRTVRVVIGVLALIVSLAFGWGSFVGTLVGIGLLAVAGLMFVTAAIGYCPTYRLINISTYPTFHRISKSEAEIAAHR